MRSSDLAALAPDGNIEAPVVTGLPVCLAKFPNVEIPALGSLLCPFINQPCTFLEPLKDTGLDTLFEISLKILWNYARKTYHIMSVPLRPFGNYPTEDCR